MRSRWFIAKIPFCEPALRPPVGPREFPMSAARDAIAELAYAFGTPTTSALFKQRVEDFCVTEDLGFTPTGEGEHVCLHLRKRGITTQSLVRHLASMARIREQDVGYAGLKDRQGICTQWFSLYLPGQPEVATSSLANIGVELLAYSRNSRKIRRGSHRANDFHIRLRGVEAAQHDILEQRLAQILAQGVPNYFGEQRFGVANQNVADAQRLFSGEITLRKGFRRGMLLSSARSYLFNELLSERVTQGCWNHYLPGDVMNLAGSESVFVPQLWDATLAARLETGDIHPTGPLWGKGALRTSADSRALEERVSSRHPALCTGLEQAGLLQSRRALRLPVGALQWEFQDVDSLELSFSLPPGAYASSVLREVCLLQEANKE